MSRATYSHPLLGPHPTPYLCSIGYCAFNPFPGLGPLLAVLTQCLLASLGPFSLSTHARNLYHLLFPFLPSFSSYLPGISLSLPFLLNLPISLYSSSSPPFTPIFLPAVSPLLPRFSSPYFLCLSGTISFPPTFSPFPPLLPQVLSLRYLTFLFFPQAPLSSSLSPHSSSHLSLQSSSLSLLSSSHQSVWLPLALHYPHLSPSVCMCICQPCPSFPLSS